LATSDFRRQGIPGGAKILSWHNRVGAIHLPSKVISTSLTPLLAALEANLHGHISFLQRSIPGMTVLDQEDVLRVDSCVASDTFNKVARARFTELEADRRIAEIIQHFRAAKRPFAWWVGPGSRPLDLEDRLSRHGLAPAESELGMSMELRNLPPRIDAARELEICRVSSQHHIADFAAIFAANWEPPDPVVLSFYRAATPILLEPRCPMILFVGYVDGAPVSCSELFVDPSPGGVAGIYSVATKREFRRRGFGSALTWAALDEARRQGISAAVLQSSEDGMGVYTRLGFTPCCHFTEYTLL
jgi:ribosomal protein S18 acetylase RimI-like enzyme